MCDLQYVVSALILPCVELLQSSTLLQRRERLQMFELAIASRIMIDQLLQCPAVNTKRARLRRSALHVYICEPTGMYYLLSQRHATFQHVPLPTCAQFHQGTVSTSIRLNIIDSCIIVRRWLLHSVVAT